MFRRFDAIIPALFICSLAACKKNGTETTPPTQPPTVDTTVVIDPAIDPPTANTIGFFLNDWQPKNFTAPSFTDTAKPASASFIVTVNPSSIITKIPQSIAGNNANLWSSQMITETSLMTHIKNLHPHIIRFPGGSISDVFFWNAEKGVAPGDAPAQLVNADGTKSTAGFWYGKNSENWTFSVENYYKMLEQTGNQGMITINYGYARYGTGTDPVAAAAHLAADWVRYDKGRTKYWEIGNENYGDWEAGYRIDVSKNKDGQPEYVTGSLYGQHFKSFADSMRKAAQEVGAAIQIGALMVESQPQSWQTPTVQTWNSGLLSKAGSSPDFYIVHNYYTPYNQNTNATEVLASAITETKKMTDFVTSTIQSNGAAQKPLALTEWNIFAQGSMQAVSHINGMHAVLVMGEALKNKIGMTSRWDFANGWDSGNDHGLFSQGPQGGVEPGVSPWNPRPAFYHMYFFQKFLGDRLINSSIASNTNVETYASSFSSGQVALTLVNKSTTAQTLEIKVQNFRMGSRYYWYTLSGGDDNGEFSRKVYVNGKTSSEAAGGPADYASLKAYSSSTQGGIKITIPSRSVVCMAIDKK